MGYVSLQEGNFFLKRTSLKTTTILEFPQRVGLQENRGHILSNKVQGSLSLGMIRIPTEVRPFASQAFGGYAVVNMWTCPQ